MSISAQLIFDVPSLTHRVINMLRKLFKRGVGRLMITKTIRLLR